MKITRLQVRCVSVPMQEPHRTASGVIAASPLVLLTVHCDEGEPGHAIVFSYSPAALRPLGDLLVNVEPLLLGQQVAPAALSGMLQARFRLLGTQGLVGMALAGIDMALWDCLARSQGLPLHALLGGEMKPVRCYGGVGYDGVAASAKAAEGWARKGFQGVKAKIGYPTLAEDIAVVRAMRKAVGPDVDVMVDYNQSLTPGEARTRLAALDDEGLGWVEEPILAHDFSGFVDLARRSRTPLQAGENWWGPLDFRHAFDAGVGERVMPDVVKCGGVTGWLAVSAMAQVHGAEVSSHLWPEVSAQLLCATPTARWLEYVDWWNGVLKQPLEVREGVAQVEGVKGCGIEFDEAAVERLLA